MRYSLLASASLMAFAFAAALTPANAADCGCRDAVRAALAKQAPAVQHAPMPVVQPPQKRAAARVAHRTVPACNCGPAPRAAMPRAASYAEGGYDYRSARAVDTYPYTHHWTVAPQGYVPPVAMASASAGIPAYDGPTDLPPYGPMPAGYGDAGGGATAYAEAPAITVDQQGWIGGVGYGHEGGGGGGGGGGGMTLTLAQPDSSNGPSYNSFGQSYGGDYQSANQVNAWRTQAFTPPATTTSK